MLNKRAKGNKGEDIACEYLERQGFKCVPITRIIPDIIAIRDGELYAIEVEYGKPKYEKYNIDNYKSYFKEVIWIIRKAKKTI